MAVATTDIEKALGEMVANGRCALAAMFASGSADFSDVILPLLRSDDQQVRLATYRAWPEFHLSSLGGDWRKIVGPWQEPAANS